MKKGMREKRTSTKRILLIIGGVLVFTFVILPLFLILFDGSKIGNVAIIPIEGPIMVGSGQVFSGEAVVSSGDITNFIQEAEQNPQIKAIILVINSPGGSAVASDEIAAAVVKAEKPVVALIREVGASGGYWVASAADYIVANRMSITGSIGVISSYLEFSGLLNDYNVTYQRMIAGKYKDLGTPFKGLAADERTILQEKLNTIHDFFIQGVAENRGLDVNAVRKIATGEFYLGIEALKLGLVDELGDMATVEQYLRTNYNLDSLEPVVYQREIGFLELLAGVAADFSFDLGRGFASWTLQENKMILMT
ncbi:MAG: signal peptide peptidase SppA [Nanoarchaeota archaeon]|nr:signal peptide peptidase SppA [Nanoarchaeota archaeon]